MIKLKGFEEISRKLKELDSKVSNKIVRKGVSKMAQIVRKDMRARSPNKTGTLRKELRYKITRLKTGGFNAEVGAFNKAFYANFIEKGTKKHTIKPKKGNKVISFGGRSAASVSHPGTKARPFIEPALKSKQNEAVREAGRIIMSEILKIL